VGLDALKSTGRYKYNGLMTETSRKSRDKKEEALSERERHNKKERLTQTRRVRSSSERNEERSKIKTKEGSLFSSQSRE
jgi:hypothetical protein